MQDFITKEIIINGTQEAVYNAITKPENIIKWFPNEIEGTLDVGQQATLIFTKQNHRAPIYIEAATPFSYFAYRWVPSTVTRTEDPRTVAHTLVEFFIEAQNDVTKVTLKESGFSTLPPEIAEKMLSQNSGGWDFMLGRLQKIMNA